MKDSDKTFFGTFFEAKRGGRMKKKVLWIVGSVLTALIVAAVIVCVVKGAIDKGETNNIPQDANSKSVTKSQQVIKYKVEEEWCEISVTPDDNYILPSIPTKFGYIFDGLYDRETDGTKMVGADGASINPFASDLTTTIYYARWIPKEYKIVFNANGGVFGYNNGTRCSVLYDEEIGCAVPAVSKEYYDFEGYYLGTDKDAVLVADENGFVSGYAYLNEKNYAKEVFDSDIIELYAKFSKKKYTVKFYCDQSDYTSYVEKQIEYGTTIEESGIVLYDGDKRVLTWKTDSMSDKVFTEAIQHDCSLYACDYGACITLYYNSKIRHGTITAKVGDTVELPVLPDETLKKFLYWANGNGEKITLSQMPDHDMTLYAVWEQYYTLKLYSSRSTLYKTITAKSGDTVELPVLPDETLQKFLYWANGNGEKITLSQMPDYDVTLYAVWEEMYHTVYYDYDGGSVSNESKQYKSGDRIAYNNDVTKSDYVFAGWDGYQETMPDKDITVKAIWKRVSYTTPIDYAEYYGDQSRDFSIDSFDIDWLAAQGYSQVIVTAYFSAKKDGPSFSITINNKTDVKFKFDTGSDYSDFSFSATQYTLDDIKAGKATVEFFASFFNGQKNSFYIKNVYLKITVTK